MSNGPDQNQGWAGGTQAKSPGFFTVFPSIMLPMFLAVVDQTIVATALPAIAASTGNVERASWIVVSYLIASTIAAPIYGRLGDAFGRRSLMFAALGVFIVASLLCAVSPTVELLTLARLLQGLGGGGLMTLSQALVGEAIPPRERARYQGYLATVAVCANTFGPVAGGYLSEHFGWPSIFLINVPIGLGAMVADLAAAGTRGRTSRLARRSRRALPVHAVCRHHAAVARADPACRTCGAAARGALLAAGLIALVLLIRHENRAPSPLIPLGLLRMPAIWHSDALAACHGGALVSLITFLPVYLEVVRGESPSSTGLLLVPLTIGIGMGSLLTGRLVNKTGFTTLFPVIGLVFATANLVVLALWASALGTAMLSTVLLLIGLFMGTVMGVVQVTRAERLGAGAARRSRRLRAVFALDRCGLRHRAGGDRAVCLSRHPQSGRGQRLRQHDPASASRRRRVRRSAGEHSGRHRGGVSRGVFDRGGVHDRGIFPRAHQSAAADLRPSA